MSRPITQDCPSCQGSGYGPMGDYSPRLPVCEQCDGTGEVERCLECAQIIVEGRCACPCDCGNCDECSDNRCNETAYFRIHRDDYGVSCQCVLGAEHAGQHVIERNGQRRYWMTKETHQAPDRGGKETT